MLQDNPHRDNSHHHRPNRRQFLQAMGGALGAAALGPRAWGAPGERPPNVLLLYTDDQGTLDLGVYGADDLETPHLDALAGRGVRLTQAYCAAPVCSASRAALMTGCYPHRTGIPANSESHPSRFGTTRGLRQDRITIAEHFQAAGYRTACFGKWHMGADPGPLGHGFDEHIGFLSGCIDRWSHFSYGGAEWGKPPQWHDWYKDGERHWESGAHAGDIIVREAARFAREHAQQPWMQYVAFGSPHYPMQPYDRWREHYAHLDEPRRAYAALMSTLDEQIGRLLTALDEMGQRENTLVIFQSDHGHSTEARANYGGGYAGDLRGAKFSLLEGGIRVPSVVSLPGVLPEGAVRDQFATACDWLPTSAALCGLDPVADIDGHDISAQLRDGRVPTPHERWHWDFSSSYAVREGDWKLIDDPRDTTTGDHQRIEGTFLYNLADDPGERHNLAEAEPGRVQRYERLHRDWRRYVARS